MKRLKQRHWSVPLLHHPPLMSYRLCNMIMAKSLKSAQEVNYLMPHKDSVHNEVMRGATLLSCDPRRT